MTSGGSNFFKALSDGVGLGDLGVTSAAFHLLDLRPSLYRGGDLRKRFHQDLAARSDSPPVSHEGRFAEKRRLKRDRVEARHVPGAVAAEQTDGFGVSLYHRIECLMPAGAGPTTMLNQSRCIDSDW